MWLSPRVGSGLQRLLARLIFASRTSSPTWERDEMRPQRTFEAISSVLDDGSWHEFDELREATRFPVEWVEQLRAEGVEQGAGAARE